jgi:predicted enzyme related to lactoylglutathione lyase
MKRVTGLGGVFFRAKDPPAIAKWYKQHLGIPAMVSEQGTAMSVFSWREKGRGGADGVTVWSAFPRTTKYFGKSGQTWMFNYRVADLEKLLAALRSEGVEVDDHVESSDYGRFGWIVDPEGNRVELWEPPAPNRRQRRRTRARRSTRTGRRSGSARR